MRKAASALVPVSAPAMAGNVSPMVDKVLSSPGQALETGARSYFEPRFGSDFSRVRIHTGGEAARSAQEVNALAYTVGSHIVFAQGLYQPGTSSGRRLLAHELAHTLQSPESGGILRPLRISPVDDPSERAADHAANAVMRGESASLSPQSGPFLRRQQAARTCTATTPTSDKPDRSDVHCSDNSDYHVTMTLSPNPPTAATRVSVNAGFNETALKLRIDICHGGTEVIITPTTGDLSQPVKTIVSNILKGSSALSGATVTPGLDFTILKDKKFTISVRPTVTVGQHGVTGGGGDISVQTKDVTISVGGGYDSATRTGNVHVGVGGGSPQQDVSCTKNSEPTVVFTCEQITHTTIPAVPQQTQDDLEVRYIFFHYPTAKIRMDFRPPDKDDFKKLAGDGFKVTAIDGYTSPEGPKGTEHMPQFEGNKALSDERATAAHDWIEKNVPELDLKGVPVTGRVELPPVVGADPKDTEGKGMERAAVKEFLGESAEMKPDELAPKDPAEVAAFKKLPESKQRNKAFELMRRAKIQLKRTRITQQAQPAKPGPDQPASVACPKDVTDAARPRFGIF